MATLTVRNLEEAVRDRLRVRAAQNGHSMEEEVRVTLRNSVSQSAPNRLWAHSRELFSGDKGIDLNLPSRDVDRPAPDFS